MDSTLNNLLQLFSTHGRRIATLLSILVIVAMSLSVARSVLFFMELSAPAPMRPVQQSAPSVDASQLNWKVSDLELFGKAVAPAELVEAVDAPETQLNLELQGVFIADDDSHSTAIVAEKNKTGELFAIGDRLPGNATLAAVFVDHVLIRRGSRMERLMFSDNQFRSVAPDTEDQVTEGSVPSTPAAQQSRLDQLRNRLRNKAESAAEANPARQALTQYQQKLQDDPAGTLSEMGISAVSDGESNGYSVGSEAQGAIRQAGLQPGDVILSINGRPVGNVADDTALIDQVMSSSRVRVEVQRGQRRFFLTVPVPR